MAVPRSWEDFSATLGALTCWLQLWSPTLAKNCALKVFTTSRAVGLSSQNSRKGVQQGVNHLNGEFGRGTTAGVNLSGFVCLESQHIVGSRDLLSIVNSVWYTAPVLPMTLIIFLSWR